MPMPPSCASAIASAVSVTVSIGADSSGMFNSMARVSRVCVSASDGTKSLRAGISSTSSNVIPSCRILGCSMCEEYRETGGDVKVLAAVQPNTIYFEYERHTRCPTPPAHHEHARRVWRKAVYRRHSNTGLGGCGSCAGRIFARRSDRAVPAPGPLRCLCGPFLLLRPVSYTHLTLPTI